MTPAEIRVMSRRHGLDSGIAETLRACADVVEAARNEESHTGRKCETVRCRVCEALFRLEALKP